MGPSYETARIMARDFAARDHFGHSVALSSYTLFAGAPLDDTMGLNGGAVYSHDTQFVRLGFRQKIFRVMENVFSKRAEVQVIREGDLSTPLIIGYATSDLSALGIDQMKYDACLAIPQGDRKSDCGDYRHTSGELEFLASQKASSFFVPVMEDSCYEHGVEVFRVTLQIPGGGAILGEGYSAVVRIDDDDFLNDPCV